MTNVESLSFLSSVAPRRDSSNRQPWLKPTATLVASLRDAISGLKTFPAPGTFSPLTPALSPLRGEGVASDARRILVARRRVCFASDRINPNNRSASNAVKGDVRAEAIRRAPSPLNGERAGVRGEAVRSGCIPIVGLEIDACHERTALTL